MSKSILIGAGLLCTTGALFALNVPVSAEVTRAPVQSVSGAGQPRGRALFVAQGCYQCHGYEGQGSIMSGPSLTPMRKSGAAFAAYVRAPTGVMPVYSSKLLPDADLALIQAYVAGLPQPRPASSIPLLARFLGGSPAVARAARPKANPSAMLPATSGKAAAEPEADGGEGARLFAGNCAACHGAKMQGGFGPALHGEATKRTAAETLALLLDPPAPMPKLSPDPLSLKQMEAIASYVRSEKR